MACERQAILTALSSTGYWGLFRTRVTQTRVPNDWLKRQGLISERDCWVKANGYV